MTIDMHAAAPHHLPFFVTPPGQTDGLMVAMAVFLVVALVSVGVFYLTLHALPEQMAHKGQKAQFQIVAVLGLLALFTHNHVFWIGALLLAMVELPDVTAPLSSISRSLETLAGRQPAAATPPAAQPSAAPPPADPGARGDSAAATGQEA
jgi:hypothetical protein